MVLEIGGICTFVLERHRRHSRLFARKRRQLFRCQYYVSICTVVLESGGICTFVLERQRRHSRPFARKRRQLFRCQYLYCCTSNTSSKVSASDPVELQLRRRRRHTDFCTRNASSKTSRKASKQSSEINRAANKLAASQEARNGSSERELQQAVQQALRDVDFDVAPPQVASVFVRLY